MNDTLEPGDVDQYGNRYPDENKLDSIVIDLERRNIIYIKGMAYELASYGEMYEDGSRRATLRLYSPF